MSVVAPAVLAIYGHQRILVDYHVRGWIVEGKAVASGMALVVLLSLVLCLVGFILGAFSYSRAQPPRPLARKLELAAFAIPPLLWFFFAEPMFAWVRGP